MSGFHPLPPRTGHEVFPHPALRQPSSWSIQDSVDENFGNEAAFESAG